MAHRIAAALVAACLVSVCGAGFPAVEPTQGEPWPTPTSLQLANTSLLVPSPDQLQFRLVGDQCAELSAAVERTKEVISGLVRAAGRRTASQRQTMLETTTAELARVDVNLTGGCPEPALPEFGMDESYTLEVSHADGAGLATLTAASLWGALRGLETLPQLMWPAGDGGLNVREASIEDTPRYSHRGILLDTARHFFSTDAIKQVLDAMAANKFNVFHWHIVDYQSFPYVSTAFPSLSELGAYSPDMVYSPDDVSGIIEYARVRGIRVVPEFDTPGHTRSWGPGLPGFLTACCGPDGNPDGSFGPVDPSNPDVYQTMQALLGEVTARFPDKYVHLGADEVSFGFQCWLSNPRIQAWMAGLNISTPEEVENVYIQQLLDLVEKLPTAPEYIVWQEVIDNAIKVKPETIVEVWKGGWQDELSRVTSLGQRAILASPWYLDIISYGADWQGYYDAEPESFGGSDDQNALVMGGEACLWTEWVDETNLMSRLWPRASAVAERLWSPKETTRDDHTASRLEEHRCRMLKRGFSPEPSNGPGFC